MTITFENYNQQYNEASEKRRKIRADRKQASVERITFAIVNYINLAITDMLEAFAEDAIENTDSLKPTWIKLDVLSISNHRTDAQAEILRAEELGVIQEVRQVVIDRFEDEEVGWRVKEFVLGKMGPNGLLQCKIILEKA